MLAYVYAMLGHFGLLAPADAFPVAKAAGLRALEIDETLAGVHFSLGIVRLLYDWDWPGSLADIQKGLSLAPNDAAGHFAYGEWLTVMGRLEEAVAEMEHAHDLDPLSSPISANLAAGYSFVRKHDRALDQIRKTVELDPQFYASQALFAVLLARAGRYDEAFVEAHKCILLPGFELRGQTTLGVVCALAGREQEARKAAAEIESQPPADRLASGLAAIYSVLGDRDLAFKFLEESFKVRFSNLVFIRHAPELRNLRGDPRFISLLRRIGLPS